MYNLFQQQNELPIIHVTMFLFPVCKRWRRVVEMAWQDVRTLEFPEIGWKQTDFYKFPSKFRTNQGVGKILEKIGGNVQQLMLGHPCTFNILPIVGKHCSNLTRLGIAFRNDDQNIVRFLPQMQKLEYFEICNIKFYPRQVFQYLPSETLTELHLGSRRRLPCGAVNATAPRIAAAVGFFPSEI